MEFDESREVSFSCRAGLESDRFRLALTLEQERDHARRTRETI